MNFLGVSPSDVVWPALDLDETDVFQEGGQASAGGVDGQDAIGVALHDQHGHVNLRQVGAGISQPRRDARQRRVGRRTDADLQAGVGSHWTVVGAACSITPVTSSGCEMATAWEELTSVTWEWARAAMKCCTAGVEASSWVVIRSHDGMVFQAAAVNFSPNIDAASGRSAAAITSVTDWGTSAAYTSRKLVGPDVQVGGSTAGEREGHGLQVIAERGSGVLADQFRRGLPHVGHEGRNIDQRLDLRVADGGLSGHEAADGVAYQNDRALHSQQKAVQVLRVAGHAAQRIGRSHDRIARGLQALDHGVPLGRRP